MYYLKLATGPIITLAAQPTGSNSFTTTSTTTTTTTTTAATATTTTNATKTTAPTVVKAFGSNSTGKPATGSCSKAKSQISVVTESTTKTPQKRQQHLISTNSVDISLNPDTTFPPNFNANGSGASINGGNAAAARLLDLGKRLLEATREGQIEAVRQLVVDQGAPFTSDWLGTTALHVAAQNGFVEIAEILLNGGVNRDAKTKLERTALHLAAQSGSAEIVDLLILSGADVNARDMLKMTPLHWAVERGHFSVVERLLVSGADLFLKSKFQLTPVDIARNSECYDVIELLNNWMGVGGGSGICQNSSSNLNGQPQQLLQQQPQMNLNQFSQDLNQLFNFGSGFSSDDSPLVAHTMTTATASKTSMFRNQSTGVCNTTAIPILPQNESHDILDFDCQLALIDSMNSRGSSGGTSSAMNAGGFVSCGSGGAGSGSGVESPEDKCMDLAGLGWNNLDIEPEFFLRSNDSDDGEPNVEYLMKVVEELQKENKQLRQQVEQLSTTSP